MILVAITALTGSTGFAVQKAYGAQDAAIDPALAPGFRSSEHLACDLRPTLKKKRLTEGRNAVFLLRNSNTAGNPDISVTFGAAGDLPVAGDWDGDGIDTVGFFRPSAIQFQLTNSSQGVAAADFSFFFGLATDIPVAGDFNGDGIDTVGVFRDGQFFLTNSNSNPIVEITTQFGAAGDVPVIGDWDGRPPVN